MRFGRYAGASALPAWVFWRLARPMFANPLGYDEQIFVWGGWSILKGLAEHQYVKAGENLYIRT